MAYTAHSVARAVLHNAQSRYGAKTKKTSEYVVVVIRCIDFYRASYALRGIGYDRVSVCVSVSVGVYLSVTSRSSIKTAKRLLTQTTPHDSPGTLVF